MAEPGKQQMGDGRDNYGQAAKETSKAAKNIGKGIKNAGKEVGKNTATQAAVQGTDAAVKATSAMAKAGVEAGKAVSKVAAGTAAGGPWGAAIMAALSVAWAMRHTLFKILICVCLVLVIFIACIVSLPNIIFQNITDMFGDMFGFGQEETVDINTFDAAYADFGITHDNDSLYEDINAVPPKMKPMPILGDLYKNLQGNKMTERIAVILSRFVTGSAQSFNRQTNVDLSNKFIVIDLSELKGKLLPVGMVIALDYIWDKIKSDITEKKAVIIDEIWQLVGASSNKMAAEFCLTIFKTIRGFGGAAVAATQDLSDFFGLDDGRYGRAIINNSQNKIVLNLEYDEAEYVKEVLKLSKTELRSITRFERGEALVCSGNNKVPVMVKASKSEQEMITTDRAELQKILAERRKKNEE